MTGTKTGHGPSLSDLTCSNSKVSFKLRDQYFFQSLTPKYRDASVRHSNDAAPFPFIEYFINRDPVHPKYQSKILLCIRNTGSRNAPVTVRVSGLIEQQACDF